jgi:hypothetical protein
MLNLSQKDKTFSDIKPLLQDLNKYLTSAESYKEVGNLLAGSGGYGDVSSQLVALSELVS